LAVARDTDTELRVAVLVDRPESIAVPDVLEVQHVRPSVLRAFGWTVVRVLTLDWLRDPSGCVAAVRRALTEPEAFAVPPSPPLELPDVIAAHDPSDTRAVVAAAVTGSPGVATLRGATIVFTGTLDALTRDEAELRAEAAGARVARSVTRMTTLVVAGARPGAKFEQAQKMGIPIVDEAGFVGLAVALEAAVPEATADAGEFRGGEPPVSPSSITKTIGDHDT
ncbi:MAG: hypothetical protein H6699_05385, partial [Myxococcales bacterium]|nr:hypothetical protein [Myxococcales bacterium]